MTDKEITWDKRLQIHTTGRDEVNADAWHHPYEPTPYSVLERLADSGLLGEWDTLVDYGCGKGRVDFFLSYQTKANTLGIEYDERIYDEAKLNLRSYKNSEDIRFVCMNAEDFEVTDEDAFYFFNPFSVETVEFLTSDLMSPFILFETTVAATATVPAPDTENAPTLGVIFFKSLSIFKTSPLLDNPNLLLTLLT